MSIAPGAERVPLTGSTPPAAPSPASGGGKGIKVDQKVLMMGGAVVVALIAFASSRGAAGTSGGNFDTVELDTTETDLYTAVQPELERINDQLEDLAMREKPAPAKPVVIVRPGKPSPAKPAPKPPAPSAQPNVHVYTVRKGDTLAKIAARFKVDRTRLYRANVARIEAAAKKHGKKSSGNGRWIYPGTMLVIPK